MEICFGALEPTLFEQISKQGFDVDEQSMSEYERDRDAINRLRIRGLITQSWADSAERRLHGRLIKYVACVGVKRRG